MTGHHTDVDDAALARELEALVSAEPSRALVARVRQRVAAEPVPARGLPWGWLGAAAAVAVVVVAVAATWPASSVSEPRAAPPAPQVALVPTLEPPVAAPPVDETAPDAPVAEPAAPEVVAPTPTVAPADDILAVHLDGSLMLPPVLFSAPDRAGAAWLVAQAESGGVRPPSGAPPDVAPGPIVIDPIATPPLQLAALIQGEVP